MLKVMTPLEVPSTHFDVELTETTESGTTEFGTEIMNVTDSSQLSSFDSTQQQPRLVETDIYLTKASQGVPITLDDGRNLYCGRPDLDAVIADVKEEAKKLGVTHVAVFGCGPKVLVDKLKDACRQQSQILSKVKFDVHEEIFDF
jgi:hypothetical protein